MSATIRILFELSVNAIENFITVGFLTTYLGLKYTGKKAVGCFVLGWLAAFTAVTAINYATVFESVGTYLYVAVYFLYALLFLKGTVLIKLWMAIITQIILTMIAVITIVAMSCVVNCPPQRIILEFDGLRISAVILSKILLVAVYGMILRKRYDSDMDQSMWYKLIFIPFVSVIAITTIMEIALKYPDTKYQVLSGMLAIAAANIMVYYFYTVISREYRNKLTIRLLEQQNENIRNRIEETDVFVKEMRSVRHDMKNHLLAVNWYLDEGKTAEAHDYIARLTNTSLPVIQKYVHTENMAFDAIVNSKITLCGKKNLYIEVRTSSPLLAKLEQVDTGVLFGNLLDNAIEAAEQSRNKRIAVDVQTKGEYLSVMISNSIDRSVLSENKALHTSKENKERHGIGLRNVDAVVKKYDGMIQFFEENGEFCCHILLDGNKL